MRVLVAPDKFKGTLTSIEAARAIARGLTSEGDCEIMIRPLADGGEGSHSTLAALDPTLTEKTLSLAGPVRNRIDARWLSGTNAHVYFETAQTIGLVLPGATSVPPIDRWTTGVGEWILHARDQSASSIGLFLGGSATVDGGFGMALALGFAFLAENGTALSDFRSLSSLSRITFPESPLPPIRVFTDVTSPYSGPAGSARIFARQKGADSAQIEEIEMRLERVRHSFIRAGGRDLNTVPGSGAAGGLAGPLLAHPGWDVLVESGIGFFLKRAGIEDILRTWKPDLVVSGEGCTDASTLAGKVVHGLFTLTQKFQIPFAVVSGIVRDEGVLKNAGLTRLWSTTDICGELPGQWVDHLAADRLAATAGALVKGFQKENAGGQPVVR